VEQSAGSFPAESKRKENLRSHLHVYSDNTVIPQDLSDASPFALIPEAGCRDGSNLQRATQLVHDESSQRLAPNILCDDEQRVATLCDLLK